MPKWICPCWGCTVWVYAPPVRPIHPVAANPNFQARDPTCPTHKAPMEYTDDVPTGPVTVRMATQSHLFGTVDAKLGIRVGTFPGDVPIYCDYHQRKHVYLGRWPGSTKTDTPVFLGSIYSQDSLDLCSLLATSVPWGKCDVVGGVDIIFDCGKSVVGTEGETCILVQGGFQTEKSKRVITFHAYPIEEAGTQATTFRSCRQKSRHFKLDVSGVI